MANLNDIPRNYDEAVSNLIAWHDGDDIEILYLPDPASKFVRLVEVSSSFSDENELRPVAMGASADFPFPSSVILVSKADWERVKNKEMPLPEGWELTQLREPTRRCRP